MEIRFRVDLYVHFDPVLQEVAQATQALKVGNDRLARVVAQLGGAQEGSSQKHQPAGTGAFSMSTSNASQVVENLRVEIERNNEVDAGAITLLTTLAARLEEAKNDPVAIQALVDQLRGSSDALAAAVVANTPAAEGDAETDDE